jgi:cobalt/nickel transport system permease protein
MWSAAAAVTAYSARRVQAGLDNAKIPLMGAIGAFVFAAQMVNFAIPGTGSSGHLGGGLLLAVLLGSHAAFLVLASVLTVQALFFADGGLLALGCNIFNLGFLPCYIGYPLVYKKIVGHPHASRRKLFSGTVAAAVFSLQLGSLGVVLQTYFSGVSALPFISFFLVMQPVHLVIGLVEGLATAGIITFLRQARPEILAETETTPTAGRQSGRILMAGFLAAALLTGTVLAWFTSQQPDGLEWSVEKVAGSQPLYSTGKIHGALENVQEKTAILPDYDFQRSGDIPPENSHASLRTATPVSGILGAMLIIAFSILVGFILKNRNQRPKQMPQNSP